MDLTDEQWAVLEPLLPEDERQPRERGQLWRPAQDVFNAILWTLRIGARWQDLPARCPLYQTVHCRFSHSVDSSVFDLMLQALAEDVYDSGKLGLSECFIGGTFVVVKKGTQKWERPKGAKARRLWQLQTALVFMSPSMLSMLHHIKSPLLNKLSPRVLSTHHLNI